MLLKIFYIASALALCSCVNNKANKSLAIHQDTQKSAISDFKNAITQTKQRPINWQTAVRQVESSNLRYLSSFERVEKALSAKKRTWWTLAPEIFTLVNVSKSITEISDLSSDDVSFSILANITIPNPFRFYAQLYADYMGMLNAQWQHELNRRKFQVELYNLYTRQLDIDQKQDKLKKLERTLAHISLAKSRNTSNPTISKK